MEERAERLEREREEQARAAVAEERARIARELHDVVGHSVSVMTVQASAVRRLLRPEQEREREALLIVEQTGREALAEMRRLVGVLAAARRGAGARPAAKPSSTWTSSSTRCASPASPSTLTVEGEPESLPAGVDLAAYRLVQEGLTNTLKHAKAQRAEVLVRYGNGEVERASSRTTATARAERRRRPRSGRVSASASPVAGGELDAGPRAGGGFQVRARLPMNGVMPEPPDRHRHLPLLGRRGLDRRCCAGCGTATRR